MGTSAPPSLRILVIDDNADSAEAMALLLELAGHQVSVRHDGTSGVEEALRFSPHVVFCDITMPGGMDGYGVAAALRSHAQTGSARLVAVTGMVGVVDRKRAEGAGFDEFLPKPFDQIALFGALQKPGALARPFARARAPSTRSY